MRRQRRTPMPGLATLVGGASAMPLRHEGCAVSSRPEQSEASTSGSLLRLFKAESSEGCRQNITGPPSDHHFASSAALMIPNSAQVQRRRDSIGQRLRAQADCPYFECRWLSRRCRWCLFRSAVAPAPASQVRLDMQIIIRQPMLISAFCGLTFFLQYRLQFY